ncbi:hypothetical protein ABW20_dc0102417 [Dactylellina cionopaga]|nr:hypothetical protein ABW20_dc0102417 [Dactylellina cionopaga]
MCIQDPSGLDAIVADGQFQALLKTFLLDDFRDDLRKEVSNAITIACNNACVAPNTELVSDNSSTQPADVALYIWKSLYSLIPSTLELVHQSLETFEATQEVFTLISGYRKSDVQPAIYFSDWCTLLLNHRCQESIDGLMQDNVIYGLSNLMITCIKIADGPYDPSWTSYEDFILQADTLSNPPNPLSTLKTIFANLQDSWQKAFEPKDFVATIRDYDGDLIDVGIQMDVEEFYNLLCDRIESQIALPDAKKDFRAFFGGTFVQQVKSMECEHVSEREESFSAIQCDIKGKKNLQESLKAYVEGETLNGGG